MIILKKKNFKLDFECDWNEFGLGVLILKPPSPRSKYHVGISIRLLWFCTVFRFWGKKSIPSILELQMKTRLKGFTPSFWYKTLIEFHNNKSIDLMWNWNSFGTMLFYKSTDICDCSPVNCASLNILWLVILFDFRHTS